MVFGPPPRFYYSKQVMKKLFTVAVLLLSLSQLLAQDAYPFYYPMKDDNGKWGYVDDNGRWVILPKYSAVLYETNGGMYPVSQNGKWGFVGVSGEKLTDIIYDACVCEIDYPKNHYTYNFAAVRQKGKWACINVQGRFVTEFKYDEVMIYNGKYVVKIREGKKMRTGHLDAGGNEIWDN